MLRVVIQLFVLVKIVVGGALFPDLPVGVPGLPRDTPCAVQDQLFRDNLKNLSLWAYQMSEASGRDAKGRLLGNSFDFGNFEECMMINEPIKGKYCLVTITLKNIPKIKHTYKERWLHYEPNGSVLRKIYYDEDDHTLQRKDSVQIGWCVPSICETSQLQSSLDQYLLDVDHILKKENVTFEAIVNEALCQTKEQETFGPIQIGFMVLTGAIILLVLLATFIDYIERKQGAKQSGNKFVEIFSAIDNTVNLGKANYDTGLNSLNGMKFLGIFFVLIGHLICLKITFNPTNSYMIEDLSRSAMILIFNSSLFVDTFFVIGGFLLAYKMVKTKRLGNPGMYIIMRYISLTPSYAYIIFFDVAILKYLGHGPIWPAIVGAETQTCEKYWWANLLYISNYYNGNNLCLIQSWYLNCDFHYFIVGLLIMYIVRYDKRIGKYVLYLTLLTFTIIPITLSYIENIRMVHTFSIELLRRLNKTDRFLQMYITSHGRAQPYIIGMMGGLVFAKLEEQKKTLKVIGGYGLLLASSTSLIFGMVSGSYFHYIDYVYNRILESAYLGIYRMFWAAGTVGLVLYVNFGNSLILKNILGCKAFVALGKLIYGVYLVHMLLVSRHFGGIANSWRYDGFDMFALLAGYLAESFFFSFLLYICIEAPVKNMYRIFTTKSRPKEMNSGGAVNDAFKTHV